jgi:hypothetical protein
MRPAEPTNPNAHTYVDVMGFNDVGTHSFWLRKKMDFNEREWNWFPKELCYFWFVTTQKLQ